MKGSSNPIVLKDPFPTQQQLIDHQSLHGPSSSIHEVKMMSSETINLNTRAHSYDLPPEKKFDEVHSDKHSASTPPPGNGLHIKKPIPETNFRPPKSMLCKSVITPNARAA